MKIKQAEESLEASTLKCHLWARMHLVQVRSDVKTDRTLLLLLDFSLLPRLVKKAMSSLKHALENSWIFYFQARTTSTKHKCASGENRFFCSWKKDLDQLSQLHEQNSAHTDRVCRFIWAGTKISFRGCTMCEAVPSHQMNYFSRGAHWTVLVVFSRLSSLWSQWTNWGGINTLELFVKEQQLQRIGSFSTIVQ